MSESSRSARRDELGILHRDEDLLVVDKPPGMLVVEAPGRRGPTVVDRLSRQLGERVYAVHRLDEDTSGVLVVARSAAGRDGLDALFREHRAQRVYLALTTSVPNPRAGRIESWLEVGRDGIVRSSSRPGRGERAVTEYRVRERRGPDALIECRLETGRRNQIRVHLAELGCPIVGDRKYGWRARRGGGGQGIRRPLLHAWRITFEHPVTGAMVEVEAMPPEQALRP